MPSVVPVAATVPFAMAAADAAADFDIVGTLGQLGIGAALVGFAIWLQDKFTKQRKEAEELLRGERDKAHADALAAKDELIALLKDKLAQCEGGR
jgi:hypothetical protein